jgi:hypothetical protein
MAKRRDYIPSSVADFQPFHQEFCKQIVAKAKKWGIPPAMVLALEELRESYEAAYKIYTDKYNRTRMQGMAHEALRKQYISMIRLVMQGFIVHNPKVTVTEKSGIGWGLVEKRRKQLSKIEDAAMCVPFARGGGSVRFNCSKRTRVGRPKLHAECHAVEVEYCITPTSNLLDLRSFDATGRHTSSRAQFSLNIGHIGQWVHARARWVNTSDPRRSGPWGEARMVLIH